MLLLTPEVEEITRWFEWTHDIETSGFGAARWRRVSLPGPGSLGDQDARLMQALDHVRDVSNQGLAEQQRDASDRAARKRARHG